MNARLIIAAWARELCPTRLRNNGLNGSGEREGG